MADQKEILLYEVQFDAKSVNQQAVEARLKLQQLRAEKKQLDADFKANKVNAQDYAAALQANATASRLASAEVQTHTRVLANHDRQQKAAEDSVIALRAQLSNLTLAWDGLSKSERENANTGELLKDKIKSVSDELKQLESSTGRDQRNVGNYIRDINIAGINIGDVADKVQYGKEAFGAITTAIKGARGGMLAFVAVPIIALLVGLVAFLKSTEEGAEGLERAVAFLTGGLDSLAKGLAPLGKLLYDTFTNPLGTLKKLVAGTDEYKVSLGDVAANALKAAKASATYTGVLQDVEDAENALIVQRAKVGLQVDLALLAVKDRSKSERERLGLLAAAGKAESELARIQVANAKKLADALRDRLAVEAKQAALNNDQLKEQADDKRTANAKKAAQDRVALAEIELIAAKRRGVDTLAIEETIIRRTADAAKIGSDVSATQRKLIEAKANADILALRTKHAAELIALDFGRQEDVTSARLALIRKGSDDEFNLRRTLLEQQLQKEKSAAVEAANEDAKLRAGLNAKLRLLDAKFNADTEALDKQQATDRIERANDLGQKRAQTEFDLNAQTIAATIAYQAKLIDLEEKHSLEILALDEATDEDRLVKLNAIQAKAIAARKALAAQELEQEKKDAIALTEARIVQARDGSQKELDLRKDLLHKQRDLELAAAKDNESEKAKIKAQYRDQEEKLETEHAQLVAGKIVDSLEKSSGILSKTFDALSQSQAKSLQQQQDAALKSAGLSADQRAKIEERFALKKAELDKKAAERRKKIATLENIISVARGEVDAITKNVGNPFLQILESALVIGTGLAQQAVIESTTFAAQGAFITDRKGNIVRGAGTSTSDSIPARLSNGESVINARSTNRFYDMLSAINVAGGGRAFPNAKASQPTIQTNFAYGGVSFSQPTSTAATVDSAAISALITKGIAEAIATMPAPQVAVTDIRSETAKVVRVEQRSSR